MHNDRKTNKLRIRSSFRYHNTPQRIRHTQKTFHLNYKCAAREKFVETTSARFQELNRTQTHSSNNADKKTFPKEMGKHYNQNFSPDLNRLIKLTPPTPHTWTTTNRIHELTRQINTKTAKKKKQTENWTETGPPHQRIQITQSYQKSQQLKHWKSTKA